MEVIKTAIDGVFILEPRIFNDARGYFFESFSGREFEEKVCRTTFVQDNESMSSYGVMRGVYYAACISRNLLSHKANWCV